MIKLHFLNFVKEDLLQYTLYIYILSVLTISQSCKISKYVKTFKAMYAVFCTNINFKTDIYKLLD